MLERCDERQLHALALLVAGLGRGEVVGGTPRPVWLPYVEVTDIAAITGRARGLGAAVLLEPREGPAGWRSLVAAPAGGDLAVWQSKEHRRRDGDARAMSSGSSAGLSGTVHRTRRRTT